MTRPFVVAQCMPVYRDVGFAAAASLEALALGWDANTPRHWYLKRHSFRGQPVMDVRNRLARWALADQTGESPPKTGSRMLDDEGPPADVILWHDSDVSPSPPEAMELLMTMEAAPDDVALVGAPCLRSEKDCDIVNVNFNGFESSVDAVNFGQCAEVAQVGFGCVVTRASVFRAMPFPWFKWGYGDGDVDKGIGEDMGFCDEARQLGFSIFCHGGIRPVHTYSVARRFVGACRPEGATR